jgi:hypothetical protein
MVEVRNTQSSNVVPLHPEPKPLPPITALSFVKDYWVREPGKKRGHSFRCFWSVSPSGDYDADCQAGNLMALEWLRFAQACREGGPAASCTLGWLARDMPTKRTGLEAGFFGIIGYAAEAGAVYAEALVKYRESSRA